MDNPQEGITTGEEIGSTRTFKDLQSDQGYSSLMKKEPNFNKNKANLIYTIEIKEKNIREKHSQEMKVLFNDLERRGMRKQGPGYLQIAELKGKQIEEDIEIYVNALLSTIDKNRVVYEEDEKVLIQDMVDRLEAIVKSENNGIRRRLHADGWANEKAFSDAALAALPSKSLFIRNYLTQKIQLRAINVNDELKKKHKSDLLQHPKVVFPLHGIRTQAAWQRAFADVAQDAGWKCRLNEWYFGNFPIYQFLLPWSRAAKVSWFRETYNKEVKHLGIVLNSNKYPSVIAHSFGTYILGNAMLKYDYLRFNKVILCGSILPRDFPWSELIQQGQVQAVRNEYGVRDIWASCVGLFINQTGASGTKGFTCNHERFEQERFDYDHSEYFEKGHMEAKWLPFLEKLLPFIPSQTIDV